MTLDVEKTTPVTEPQVQLNIGADFRMLAPPSGEIYGHLDARDPITGAKKWEVRFPEPPMASVLVDRRQPGVRAGQPRHPARLQRRDRHGALDPLTASATGRHHQLRRGRQAVHRRHGGLRQHGQRRFRGDVRRALQEHAARRGHPGRLQPEVGACKGGGARRRPPRIFSTPEREPMPVKPPCPPPLGAGLWLSRLIGVAPPTAADQPRRAGLDPRRRAIVRDHVRLVPLRWRPHRRQRSAADEYRAQRRLHPQPHQERQGRRHAGVRRDLFRRRHRRIIAYIRALKPE